MSLTIRRAARIKPISVANGTFQILDRQVHVCRVRVFVCATSSTTAMNQMERLQRLRKGGDAPARLTLQISHDNPDDPR